MTGLVNVQISTKPGEHFHKWKTAYFTNQGCSRTKERVASQGDHIWGSHC